MGCNYFGLLVLLVSVQYCIFPVKALDDDESKITSECEANCKFKEEYCDSYTSNCMSCQTICLPPTNPKFDACGRHCVPFLQVFTQFSVANLRCENVIMPLILREINFIDSM